MDKIVEAMARELCAQDCELDQDRTIQGRPAWKLYQGDALRLLAVAGPMVVEMCSDEWSSDPKHHDVRLNRLKEQFNGNG